MGNVDKSTSIRVTALEFKNMKARVARFKLNHIGRNPRTVALKRKSVNDSKNPEYITWAKYGEMVLREKTWMALNKTKKAPNYIMINKVSTIPTKMPTTPAVKSKYKRGPAVIKAEGLLGVKLTSAKSLYTYFKDHVLYAYYYNDKYSNTTVVKRIKQGLGINCTDSAQFVRSILIDMGYQTRLVRGLVKCSNGKWYGHVWVEIKGIEYSNWTYFDVVAVTHDGVKRPLGSLCCIGGVKEKTINPKWLFERDLTI